VILALDIAFANLGWVVMDGGVPIAHGTIRSAKTKKKNVRVSDDFAFRCGEIGSELIGIIEKYQPHGVIGELPHGSQSAIAAKSLGAASGIVAGVVSCNGLPIEYISEGDSKKAALGVRSASKEDAMDWCRGKYPDIKWPKAKCVFEHIADAVMAYNGMKNGVLVRAFG
jgi:Holliday junction resolvasome RuvABC endonuclease subunit